MMSKKDVAEYIQRCDCRWGRWEGYFGRGGDEVVRTNCIASEK
jgi:hypothetical protein